MTVKYWTGIGARITPHRILTVMSRLGVALEERGYTLRSGGADGADTACALSVVNKDIYPPWNGFNNHKLYHPVSETALEIAAKWHPVWNKLRDSEKLLMGRNVYEVLGHTLDTPSDFAVCWTPDGVITHAERSKRTGGTGLAISVCEAYGVPVFNLQRPDHLARIQRFIERVP